MERGRGEQRALRVVGFPLILEKALLILWKPRATQDHILKQTLDRIHTVSKAHEEESLFPWCRHPLLYEGVL